MLALLDLGELEQARTLLEEHRATFQDNFFWRQAHALLLAVEGRAAEAREAMDAETLKFAAGIFLVTLETAEFYALLGDISDGGRLGPDRGSPWRRTGRADAPQSAARIDPGDPRLRQILQSIEARRSRRPAHRPFIS